TGPGVTTDGGATSTDGGTSAVELCREVETPFDESTAPVSEMEMSNWRADISALGATNWTTSLDGTVESEVNVGTTWSGELVIVDWVADGSEGAIFPCQEGPAVRAWLEINVTVLPGDALGTLAGAIDTNGVGYWFTRMRTTAPSLSEDWQTLVDSAEDEAGRPDATTFMEIVNPPDAGASLVIGSETTTWSQAWWSGPLKQGSGLIPAD
ncbi:hypothetical protein L6R53_09560, partial [Myxococcota bacterium]|nr:hypothetical protein [Myxococcota bacterium]